MAEIGKDILYAKRLLEEGELVAIPTETVYGLAGNALRDDSLAKIFSVKERPEFDPLIVHVSSVHAVENYVSNFPEQAKALAEQFWPGPLTLLLKKKNNIPDLATAGLDSVGIRCPDHLLSRELLSMLPFPLAAPSANPFGYISPTKPEHVNEQLGGKIKYILDGGICPVGIESTILGFENEGPVVYRLGGLSLEKIEAAIGKVRVQLHSASNPRAPGQLKSHYAPKKKFILGNLDQLIATYKNEKIAVLSFQKTYDTAHQITLSNSGKVEEAAQRLFSALRELDKMPVNLILGELVPDEGLGRAINDRLRRASAE
jgi:L-threonylcarbamoyladenylate synthase